MNDIEIHLSLKAIYQELADSLRKEGKPSKHVKDNYQEAKHAFLKKAKGITSSINPLPEVAERVNELWGQI